MDTATATATPTNTIPAFGTHLPTHGGHFAAIVRGATVDGVQQPPDALIFTAAEFEATTTWGEYRQDVPGCASRTDGHTNTLAMLAANDASSPDWHALDAAYLAHHFNCPTCIAAGRGSRYGFRCGTGAALWRAYTAA